MQLLELLRQLPRMKRWFESAVRYCNNLSAAWSQFSGLQSRLRMSSWITAITNGWFIIIYVCVMTCALTRKHGQADDVLKQAMAVNRQLEAKVAAQAEQLSRVTAKLQPALVTASAAISARQVCVVCYASSNPLQRRQSLFGSCIFHRLLSRGRQTHWFHLAHWPNSWSL